ncbi:hypothetical protein KA021_00315 [Candidatus Saccharibacteria bacterium]|jgi:amicyanin|nr:hypothetical protein [Candidatus Saccharibacteria bacterium]
MKKSIIIIVLVVAVMGGGVGFAVGKSNSSNQSKPAAATHSEEGTSHTSTTKDATSDAVIDETSSNEVTIDIKDFKYQKQNIKIKKGTKVTWVNKDAMEHNIMKQHDGEEEAHDAPAHGEATEGLESPLISKGESWSYTFNEVGTENYHCAPHPYMKGSVTII